MATRMIVTSQPDVACDVCGRRLLRGEQPDVFLAGGRRRMVCELCAPRASAEGWLREAEQARTLNLSPARARQGRNPLARWRRPRRASSQSPIVPEQASAQLPLEPAQASARPAAAEVFEDELREVVEGAPGEPRASARPVFAGAIVEPAAAEPEIAELGEAGQAASGAPGDSDAPARAGFAEREALDGTEGDGLAEPDTSEGAESAEPAGSEEVEEGSWRDAWMFVGE